ncbi:MAG: YicC family protein [Gammaproteobacteria bacterium]|nr:YicC family protein [Gammaproteobacteria bacterium]
MPYSMTAFARLEFDEPWGRGAWELRSVNHRFAELGTRLPEDFRALEAAVRERVNARVRRGKIDCTLRVEMTTATRDLHVNEAAARALVQAAEHVADLCANPAPINPLEVLRWPGVTEVDSIDLDQVRAAVLDHLDDTLDAFLDARSREGEKLAELVRQRLDGIREQVAMLATRVPEIIEVVRERHENRIRELAEGLDEARVEQECALLIQRLDVAEELDRLATHVEEVARVLGQDEPIGRRLDFLLQELNREANTLGSKSAHVDTAGAAVELKVLIEQIREQIQNIE